MRFRWLLVALIATTAMRGVPQGSPTLRIVTTTLPAPVAGISYSFQLQATGGAPPYKWSVMGGALPLTLNLDPSGLLAGTPAKPGRLEFAVRVTDSATPPQSVTEQLRTETLPAIAVTWRRPPRVENGGIFGSVAVANNLAKNVELTLIIVGVNEFNKSFVLGYQHPTLAPKSATPEIPFGFTLPRGSYVVHVDAVAEDPATEALFRVRLQTPAALNVP